MTAGAFRAIYPVDILQRRFGEWKPMTVGDPLVTHGGEDRPAMPLDRLDQGGDVVDWSSAPPHPQPLLLRRPRETRSAVIMR
jgi:hypothetical protein